MTPVPFRSHADAVAEITAQFVGEWSMGPTEGDIAEVLVAIGRIGGDDLTRENLAGPWHYPSYSVRAVQAAVAAIRVIYKRMLIRETAERYEDRAEHASKREAARWQRAAREQRAALAADPRTEAQILLDAITLARQILPAPEPPGITCDTPECEGEAVIMYAGEV
jgi:hypothetical protein